MKTSIYIEDGVHQVVLTPETEFEKAALFGFVDESLKAEAFRGSFYDCRGGWVRQTSQRYQTHGGYGESEPESLILRVEAQSREPELE